MDATNLKHARRLLRGTSTLEAAFVLILLLTVTLGILGWGWFFLRIQQVTHAARHGAREAASYKADEAQVKQDVMYFLDWWGILYEEPVCSPGDLDPGAGEPVTVTVKGLGLDVLNLDSGPILWIPIPDDFTCSITMAKEGP